MYENASGKPVLVEALLPGMDPLEQMCRRMEILENEEGWDRKPHFYTMSLTGSLDRTSEAIIEYEGRGISGSLAVGEPIFPDFCYDDPAMGMMTLLQYLAEEWGKEDSRESLVRILNMMVPPGFYAFGVLYEAWTLPNHVPDDVARALSQLRMIDKHPEAIEVRGMVVATVDGRIVRLSRKRNQFPEYSEVDPTEEDLAGRVPTAVRLLTELFMKFGEWRKGAIESLKDRK